MYEDYYSKQSGGECPSLWVDVISADMDLETFSHSLNDLQYHTQTGRAVPVATAAQDGNRYYE